MSWTARSPQAGSSDHHIDEITPVGRTVAPELEPNRLYAVLTYCGDLTTWDWTFFVPDSSVSPIGSSGTLFHVRHYISDDESPTSGWELIAETKDIITFPLVVAIIRLDDVGFLGQYEEVVGEDSLLAIFKTAAIPGSTIDKPVEFNSRVWFLDAIHSLHECGVIACGDAPLLESELRRFAFDAMDKYLQNQGWTMYQSERCS